MPWATVVLPEPEPPATPIVRERDGMGPEYAARAEDAEGPPSGGPSGVRAETTVGQRITPTGCRSCSAGITFTDCVAVSAPAPGAGCAAVLAPDDGCGSEYGSPTGATT